MRSYPPLAPCRATSRATRGNAPTLPVLAPHWKAGPWRHEQRPSRRRHRVGRVAS